jgi:uncharacterized protein (TIGR03435 family)
MISFAVSILVKATLTTTLALIGAWLARNDRAAVRHLLLAAGFAVLVVLPIASVVVPSISLTVPIAVPEQTPPVAFEPLAVGGSPDVEASAGAPSPGATPATPWPSWPALLLGVWLLGTALFAAPVLAGLSEVRALCRSARAWPRGQELVDRLARELALRRRVDVRLHESLPGPMTCGFVRPVIVVPADGEEWLEEDLRRAIVHELEHVRRGDWLSQCVARIVCATYWFQPLVWVASRQLALEAERACDDAVVRRSSAALGAGSEATAYADQLVVLAERRSSGRQPQIAMASRHELATRVLAVLDGRQRRGRAGTKWVVLACALSALLVTTMSPLKVVPAFAQASTGNEQTPPQRFEAASIKPCRVEDAPPGPARGTAGGTNATASPGRMTVPCVTVEQLIYLAYGSYGATHSERLVNDEAGTASDATKVRGGPSWVHSQRDKYAVEATAPGTSERTVLMGAMLRTLLEERFHLKIHREAEEVPMYALTVAKSGFKLKPIKDGECDTDLGPPYDVDAAKPRCNSMNSRARGPNTVWTFVNLKVSALASRLSRTVGRHVIDQTAIGDDFIMRLEFHPDENTPGIVWPAERDADTTGPQAASIFTALEQQLGLKLEKTKAPRGFLVIDQIERPSPNSGGAIQGR